MTTSKKIHKKQKIILNKKKLSVRLKPLTVRLCRLLGRQDHVHRLHQLHPLTPSKNKNGIDEKERKKKYCN